MKLSETRVGQRVKLLGFASGQDGYRHQLLAMGLTPGVELVVKRLSPFGGCMQLSVRGFSLVLRRAEAAFLQVELLPALTS